MHVALSYVGGRLGDIADLTRIDSLIAEPHQLVWLDLRDPDEHELRMLRQEFEFHELSIEDAVRGHQRPKVDVYDKYYFVVMYSLSYDRSARKGENALRLGEVDIFMGHNYVVTVHKDHVPELEDAMQRWKNNPDMVRDCNIGFLLYTICDSVVDNYFPVMDAIEDEIDDVEEGIFVDFSRETIGDIFALRKDLLGLRKVVGPERDVFNMLTRRDLPVLDGSNALYFADVYDHLLRVADMIETYRDLLSSALDGYLSMTSNNLNEIMKVLTAGSIILMTVAIVPGIYGMNFKNMPELDWSIGHVWALALMLVLGVMLFAVFRRRRWL